MGPGKCVEPKVSPRLPSLSDAGHSPPFGSAGGTPALLCTSRVPPPQQSSESVSGHGPEEAGEHRGSPSSPPSDQLAGEKGGTSSSPPEAGTPGPPEASSGAAPGRWDATGGEDLELAGPALEVGSLRCRDCACWVDPEPAGPRLSARGRRDARTVAVPISMASGTGPAVAQALTKASPRARGYAWDARSAGVPEVRPLALTFMSSRCFFGTH